MRRVPYASTEAARAPMCANHGRDTGPDIAVRQALYEMRPEYRFDHPLSFNRRLCADIAFTRATVAVFVSGSIWLSFPKRGSVEAFGSAARSVVRRLV